MLTYSQSVSTLQQMTKVSTSDTTNTALLTQFWNDSIRTICAINGGKWPFLETEEEAATVANQEYVEIPNNIRKVISYRYTDGTDPQTDSTFLPRMVFDPLAWEVILAGRLGTSNWPWFAYQRGSRLYFQPIPATTGNIVTIRGRLNVRDLSIADVTNVTVTTATNGSTALTVSGSMTADFVGRWIRITETSAANGGDGEWYQIGTFTNTTTIGLKKKYQGTSIVAGTAACTIGQVPVIPEAYQMAPIYRALAQWLQINDPLHNEKRINSYWRLYDGGVEAGLSKEYGGFIGQMMEESNESMEGAYVSPVFGTNDSLGQIPYWYPWNQASGFN